MKTLENKTQFEIGKWYKWYQIDHSAYHCGKVDEVNNENLTCNPWIMHTKTYYGAGYFDIKKAVDIELLVDLSEIQQLLPDDHPDKIDNIPEYVKCVKTNGEGSYKVVGSVYKVKYYDSKTLLLEIYDHNSVSYLIGNINFKNPELKNATDYIISTKEAYDAQFKQSHTYQALPMPKDQKCFKARVLKDILKSDFKSYDLPAIIPAGSITWFENDHKNCIKNKSHKEVFPENNRYYANIPAYFFEIIEEEGDKTKLNQDSIIQESIKTEQIISSQNPSNSEDVLFYSAEQQQKAVHIAHPLTLEDLAKKNINSIQLLKTNNKKLIDSKINIIKI